MQIIPVNETNLAVYHNLVQCYEAEFSPLTGKKPDETGRFELDTELGENVQGYLLEIDRHPAGLAAIACKGEKRYEVCEFYVVPSFRQKAVGMHFAHKIWNEYPGSWEVKQIEGADNAIRFWRTTITRFNNTPFREERYDDPYWGKVTRQQFKIGG